MSTEGGAEEMDDFKVGRGEIEPEEDITGRAVELPTDPEELIGDDEPTLRPRSLDEFIGQEPLKDNLR